MLSDSIRQRLEALNRAPLPEGRWRKAPPSRSASAPRPRALVVPKEGWEGEPVENASGAHERIATPLARLWQDDGEAIEAGTARMRHQLSEQAKPHRELVAFADAFPARVLFLDLETCGFAGSAIFLIGLLRATDEGLIAEQLLARNYAEERAILETLWHTAAEHEVLATFNGKSFDWPMVHDRSTLHHLGRDSRQRRRSSVEQQARLPGAPFGPRDPRPDLLHFDLLHHARRRWRRKLPDCKLQTLEYYLCGRRREQDIAGSRIPAAYHRFVRTGQRDELQSILTHNLLDLVTLLEVALKIAG